MKNVADLRRKAEVEGEQQVGLYNPLFDDFEIEFEGKKIVVPSQGMVKLKRVEADYVAKHLRDYVINRRGYNGSIYKEREVVMKEIMV